MIEVQIESVPNQNFSFAQSGYQWLVTLQTTAGVTAVTIQRDAEVIIGGVRAVANQMIIPSYYQEAGNFAFLTLNDELPYYDKFNVSQSLVYFTPSELEVALVTQGYPVLASYFNSDGALPLRFAPKGYTVAP